MGYNVFDGNWHKWALLPLGPATTERIKRHYDWLTQEQIEQGEYQYGESAQSFGWAYRDGSCKQDHTLESIRIDIQAACQVACIVRDKMPHDAYRDELSRIATALAELCNDVSRLEMAEIDMRHSLELHKELCASLGWIKGE